METLLLISALFSWCLILCLAAAILLLGRTQVALARQLEELEITASSNSPLRGKPAPPFHLSTLDGRQELDLDGFQGRVVLVFFLSPSCVHCQRFLKMMSTLLPQLYVQQIAVIGISDGDPASMLHLVGELEVGFPILQEEQWQVSRRYGVLGRPWGIAIDAAGIVRGNGPVSSQEQITGLIQTVVPDWKMPPTSAKLRQISGSTGLVREAAK